MSQTTVNLGYVPKNRGIWVAETKYYKDNLVEYNGSAYIANPVGYDPTNPTAAYTTIAPVDENGNLNPGWEVFASGNNTFTTGESVDAIGIDNEPTPESNNLLKSGGAAEFYGYNTQNPEYVRVITDSEEKILWGIKSDGSIYFGAGVPPQIVEYVTAEIEKATPEHYQQVLDFLEGMLGGKPLSEILNDINTSLDTKAAQTDVDVLQTNVDNINSRLNKLNIAIDPDRGVLRIGNKMFKMIEYTGDADFDEDIDYTIFVEATTTLENPEWQQAITDSEDRLLYGKKQDSGEEYWPQQELEGYTMTVDGVTASVNSIIRNIK